MLVLLGYVALFVAELGVLGGISYAVSYRDEQRRRPSSARVHMVSGSEPQTEARARSSDSRGKPPVG
jgi:hypothetical protein